MRWLALRVSSRVPWRSLQRCGATGYSRAAGRPVASSSDSTPHQATYVFKTLSGASDWPQAHRAPRSVFGGYRGLAPGHASCHYALKSTRNARHGTATCPSRTTEFSSVISRQGATGADIPPRSSRTAIADRLGPTFELTCTLRRANFGICFRDQNWTAAKCQVERWVCAQHGRELMGCKSPVGVPTWTHREQDNH